MDPSPPMPGVITPVEEETAEVFQHYRVLRRPDGRLWELGRGAMGVTYKALDTNLRAPVALKLVRASLLPDAHARERFLREARAAAQLRHSHVATVYHLGEENGACFYTMEFLDGETAEQLIRRTGPLDPLTGIRIAAQVCRALQAAHARGMLHRDLKPSNLMVLHEEGEILVKVIDFGLVKSIQVAEGDAGSGASLSQGLFQGTPLYASPEQCGQDEAMDGRSDLYSLGATLWHLLSGHPPFQGTARTVITSHLAKPPPFEELARQPPAVVALLRDLLAKDPADRPADAAALRNRLRDIEQELETPRLAPASVVVPPLPLPPAVPPPPPTHYQPPPAFSPPPALQPGASPPRRGVHPLVVVGGILAALLLLAAIPVGWAIRRFTSRVPSPVPAASPTPTSPRVLPTRDDDPARAEVATGRDAFARGDFEAALAAFQRAAQVNAQSPDVLAGLRDLKATAERLAQEGSDLVGTDPVRALEKHRLAAALGSPRGQNALADQYDSGKGVAKDFAQSLAWYRRAAEAGFAPARFNLGYAYANGRGVARDDEEAARHYRQAAEQGHAPAQTELGFSLANGRGVPKDEAEAVVWNRRAADQGNAIAQLNLARLLLAGRGAPKDAEEAARWFRKAADQNNTNAQDALGDLYLSGIGVPKDEAQAVTWYRRSAERGNSIAQNDLGMMYQRGRGGLPPDDVQAAEWYRKASANNDPAGQNNLGFFYETGRGGLPKDPARATALYRLSAEQGSAFAQTNLGLALAAGRGVQKDEVTAVSWFRKAAEQGNAVAQVELGYCLAMGKGVARDDPEALAWYRKAAAAGSETGRNNLGFMLENGRGTARDLPGAIALYRQAANGGNAAAAGNLGNLYAEGRGVYRDESEALRWWRKGAASDDPRCQNALKQRGLSW